MPCPQPPLPLMAPSEAARLAAQLGGSSGFSRGTLVSLLGVVTGISTSGQCVVARRLTCGFCNRSFDVLDGAPRMPCCGSDAADAQEDMSQRCAGRARLGKGVGSMRTDSATPRHVLDLWLLDRLPTQPHFLRP